MRVLLLFNRWAFPPNDGGSVAMAQLANGLIGAGHDVYIFSLNPSRSKVDEAALASQSFAFRYRLVPIDTELTYTAAAMSLIKNESYHAIRFNSQQVHEALVEVLKTNTFDVVLADSVYMGWYIPTVRKHCKAKVALRLHNVEHEIWEGVAREETNLLKKFYYGILAKQLAGFEKKMIAGADALITLSEHDLDCYRESVNCPTHVSHTGVDMASLARYKETTVQPETVFHLAAMDWTPNIQAIQWFIKDVWPMIAASRAQAQLHLAGKKMPDDLTNLQLHNYHNYGFVADQYAFMAERKVMVVPLFSGSGIRIKIIEAMALGKAIVATSKAVQGLDLKHRTHLLIADNPRDFSQAVTDLLSNENLYTSISAHASAYAKAYFDLQKNTEQMVDFLKRL